MFNLHVVTLVFLGDSAAHGSEESNHTVATRDMCDADVIAPQVATRDTVNLLKAI